MLISLHRALLTLARYVAYIASAALVVMVALVVLSAVMRYGFRSPFHFTEEFVGLLFLATSFLTIPLNAAQGKMIRIVVLVNLVPKKFTWIVEIFFQLVLTVFSFWFFAASAEFARFAWEIEARSEQAEILLAPWMALMPCSMFLVGLISVMKLLLIANGIQPEQRPS